MKKSILAITLLASVLLTAVACGDSDNGGTTTTKGGDGATQPKQTTAAPDNTTAGPEQTDPSNPTPTDPGSSNPTETEPTGGLMFDDDEVDIFVVKGTPEVDGVRDAIWDNADTVTLDLVKKDNPSPDTVVKASAMWDENAIYFLFEITDSQIFNGGAAGDYNNDGIYLYIAENMDIYAPDADSYGWGAYQFALISPELEMLPRRGEDGSDLKAKSAYTKTEDGMIIEFCYTFTTGELANNAFIALDYQYNDCETSGTRLGAYSFYNGVDGDFNTNNLAIAKLCETKPN